MSARLRAHPRTGVSHLRTGVSRSDTLYYSSGHLRACKQIPAAAGRQAQNGLGARHGNGAPSVSARGLAPAGRAAAALASARSSLRLGAPGDSEGPETRSAQRHGMAGDSDGLLTRSVRRLGGLQILSVRSSIRGVAAPKCALYVRARPRTCRQRRCAFVRVRVYCNQKIILKSRS